MSRIALFSPALGTTSRRPQSPPLPEPARPCEVRAGTVGQFVRSCGEGAEGEIAAIRIGRGRLRKKGVSDVVFFCGGPGLNKGRPIFMN